MNELIAAVAAVITAMGLGGAVGAFIQSRLETRRRITEKEHELKERRYLCILILMLAKLRPEVGIAKVRSVRPDLSDLASLDDELRTELMNAVVFANDAVLSSIADFLMDPSGQGFATAALAMRQDLWGRSGSVSPQVIAILAQANGGPNKGAALDAGQPGIRPVGISINLPGPRK